ncbi:MAG: transporter substrate-binding domain-containing protein [Lachnospiraceae bacterium]|nr:transporter substrate-binding domain-containing protein [Lachnospiraceae bacterium]
MKKKILSILAAAFSVSLLSGTLAGCGNAAPKASAAGAEQKTESSAAGEAAGNAEVTKIKVHVSQGPAPYLYVNEDGTPDGFDYAVFKEAIDRLPQYEAEYVSATDGLTGVLSGLYDVTVGNWVWREQRGESYYFSYPYKITDKAFVQRENDEPLKDLHDAAARGYSVIVGASGGDTAALEQWNEEHPDEQIKLIYSDAGVVVRYQQVADGAADFTLDDGPMISAYFEEYQFQGIKKVTLEEEALADILPTVNTYYLYAKDEKGKKLRDDINVAIKELYQDGTLEKLSEQYFGYTTTPAAEDFESTIN